MLPINGSSVGTEAAVFLDPKIALLLQGKGELKRLIWIECAREFVEYLGGNAVRAGAEELSVQN